MIEILKLIEANKLRAERRGKVLALAWAQAHRHLDTLQVAGAPIIHDGEAGDIIQGSIVRGNIAALFLDDAGKLQLVVELLAAMRGGHRVVLPNDAGNV